MPAHRGVREPLDRRGLPFARVEARERDHVHRLVKREEREICAQDVVRLREDGVFERVALAERNRCEHRRRQQPLASSAERSARSSRLRSQASRIPSSSPSITPAAMFSAGRGRIEPTRRSAGRRG